MDHFELVSPFTPCGDQPQAIEAIASRFSDTTRSQVLLGVTGSGKTFTMANVISKLQRPTLIMAHNKTLAAQLYQEFKAFFPHNAVEYFVSYYDYYQPEAYIARTDTYIEKDLAINERIDRMRLSATRALLERRDVIIVASVSCIYGLGSPEFYKGMNLVLQVGEIRRREELLLHLVAMQYKRSEIDFKRATFRARGDVIDVFPAYEEETAIRIEMFGDEIERLSLLDPFTGKVKERLSCVAIYPSSHHVTPEGVRLTALETIRCELNERLDFYQEQGRHLETERLSQRTRYDLDMIREVGTCKGIENYSRHFSQRQPGDPPPCLIDYFPPDYLLIVDESHQTLPQVRAMHHGDRARKQALVEFGFRLPSAFDNRPLAFEEFQERVNQVLYVSATPARYEIEQSGETVVEQVIRPTGLLDPPIEVRPAAGQVDDCLEEIRCEVQAGGRVLVTALTKRLSEQLSDYLVELGVKSKYLHSDIDAIERTEILRDLRHGVFDVLVGINLLREGLDLPEVSLVAILDADKEGFLRSETALIQTCGRAARNIRGRVVLYADKQTDAIAKTLAETSRRRQLQQAYNEKHGIVPQSVKRDIASLTPIEEVTYPMSSGASLKAAEAKTPYHTTREVEEDVKRYTELMLQAAQERRFEDAAHYRDELRRCEALLLEFIA